MVEKEIQKQLSNLLKVHEDDIVDSFTSVLGKDNEELIRTRLKGICPVFMVNENDIPLNYYGNNDVYKCMPDIGEKTKNAILLALRKEMW